MQSKEEIKTMLVNFLRFCDDRDLEIKDNNFKYFQDYADDFLEENTQLFQSPAPSKDVEVAKEEIKKILWDNGCYAGKLEKMTNAVYEYIKWAEQAKEVTP